MKKLIDWLSKHRLINIQIALIYFLFMVLSHDTATKIADWLKRTLTLQTYNLVITIAVTICLILMMTYIIRVIPEIKAYRKKLIYPVVSILLMIVAYKFLLVVNIEAIHFFQYALLAILIFPLIKSYGDTVIWATLLGIVDETYQYIILNPAFQYFDFNDIILNLLGAGLGVSIMALFVLSDSSELLHRKLFSPGIITVVLITLLMGILVSLNILKLYPDESPTNNFFSIILNRAQPSGTFWTELYGDRVYHILSPREGIIIILALLFFYKTLDYHTEFEVES